MWGVQMKFRKYYELPLGVKQNANIQIIEHDGGFTYANSSGSLYSVWNELIKLKAHVLVALYYTNIVTYLPIVRPIVKSCRLISLLFLSVMKMDFCIDIHSYLDDEKSFTE